MEIQPEIRKLEANNTLPEYHKNGVTQNMLLLNSFINSDQSK